MPEPELTTADLLRQRIEAKETALADARRWVEAWRGTCDLLAAELLKLREALAKEQ